jgi:hypothetical protein
MRGWRLRLSFSLSVEVCVRGSWPACSAMAHTSSMPLRLAAARITSSSKFPKSAMRGWGRGLRGEFTEQRPAVGEGPGPAAAFCRRDVERDEVEVCVGERRALQ